ELRYPPHARRQRGLSTAVRTEPDRRGTAAPQRVAGRRDCELRQRYSVHPAHRLRLRRRWLERSESAEAGLGARVQPRQRDPERPEQLVRRERLRPAPETPLRQSPPQFLARTGPEDGRPVHLQERDRRREEPAVPSRSLQPVQPRELPDAELGGGLQQ